MDKAMKESSKLESTATGLFNHVVIQRHVQHEFLMDPPEGPPHNLIFKITLKIEDKSFLGSGPSKKAAKNEAIQKYFNSQGNSNELPNTSSPIKKKGLSNSNAEKQPQNFVGMLHEYCAKSSLPQPIYNSSLSKSSALTTYKVECRIAEWTTETEDYSKKDAKQSVSQKMIQLIDSKKGCSSSPMRTSSPIISKTSSPIISKTSSTTVPKTYSSPSVGLKSEPVNPLQSFLQGEEDIFKSTHVNFHKLLMDLGSFNDFDVTFDLQESDLNETTCIAQLGVFPVIVTLGSGANEEESINVASRNALKYIKSLYI